jgi:heat-inducible transcriptional repressor
MATDKEEALGGRKAAVLHAVIEEFIRTGEPVGSETVAERYQLNVSSATIRSEMAALEELGYLSHPHTSAGRIPTHLGYRELVDSLPARSVLRDAQRRAIARFFERAARDLEEVLVGATRLLSQLTQYAGLAIPPLSTEDRIVRAELIDLGSSLLLLVVGQHGRVYKALLPRGEHADRRAIEGAARRLDGVGDLALSEASDHVRSAAREGPAEQREMLSLIAEAFAELHRRGMAEHMLVEGVGNLAGEVATWRRDTVRVLFDALEQESEVLRVLLDTSPVEADVAVTIGAEHPMTEMWDAAIVAAPYRVGSTPLGTIGVVGPTRMDYLTAVSAVRAVSRRLSDLITALEQPPGGSRG